MSFSGETFGITDRQVLHPTVGVMDQPVEADPDPGPFPHRLLEGMQSQVRS